MTPYKIRTQFIYPPIPMRCYDWTAWLDGMEGIGPTGCGATKAEAIAKLREFAADRGMEVEGV